MNKQALEQQIQRCLDGALSEEEKKTLFIILKQDPEAMRLYCLSASMDASLSRFTNGQLSLNSGSENFADLARAYQRQRISKVSIMAAAAALLFMLVSLSFFFVDRTHTPSIAFATSPGSEFSITHSESHVTPPTGSTLENGSRLQLSRGSAELTFKSGVKSIISAPTDLTLVSNNTLQLKQGSAWFHVPEEAIGFIVQTTDLYIVDLGTEFGVLADPNNHDEIHVFKGKVQATAKRVRKQSTVLTAGKARRADPTGQLDTIPVKANNFLTELPKSLPYFHWPFDEVDGGGFSAGGLHHDKKLAFAPPRKVKAEEMLTSGKFGKAVRFTGTPGEALLTDWPGISGDQDRTIACWIRISPEALNSGGSSIAAWGKDKSGVPGWHTKWKLAISPDGKPIVVGYDGGIAGNRNVADNQWHHIACTHTMSGSGEPIVSMYIDGQLVDNLWKRNKGIQPTKSETIGIPNTITNDPQSRPLQMGKSLDNSAPIRADLDELYIFEGVLDAKTIHRLATENQHQP